MLISTPDRIGIYEVLWRNNIVVGKTVRWVGGHPESINVGIYQTAL